jgi:hypothetical protein
MKLPSVLPWWVKPAAALAVCASLLCTGWTVRGWHDAADTLKQVRKDQKAVVDANARAETANVRLIAELQKPKAGSTIREIVREHSTPCRVPDAVGDGLRQAVADTNKPTR